MAKVAVIDDRVTNRNILTRLASSVEEGLQVSAFSDPVAALNAFAGGLEPDLIITDYNMPEMDGATFVGTIRRGEGLADVPIIVVTVYEDREFCYRALEAGATDFLLSPVDHLEFRARARNLLTLRRQQRLLAQRAASLEAALGHGRDTTEGAVQAALDALPVALSAVDRQGRLTMVNRAHQTLLGQSRDELLGRTLDQTHGEDYAVRARLLHDKVFETGEPLSAPVAEAVDLATGSRRLLTVKGPVRDGVGMVNEVVTVALDVTDLEADLAATPPGRHEDRLTGLPTASIFRGRLEQELVRIRRRGEMLAVLHLDLDRFKGINDAFGRTFGDEVLRQVALRLKERLREGDTIARLDSDQFVVMQTAIRRPDDAGDLARRLSEAFAEPFMSRGRELHLSASTGITVAPSDGRTVDKLLKNADLAMYRAKGSGRDTYRFFAAEMNVAARRAVSLERELRQALARDQFVVFYQPQLALDRWRIIGVEALVRWNHPQRGVVRPGEFIGLAEDIGLIAPLTNWVLRSACAQAKAWHEEGFPGLQLSVNLSPVQFRERGVERLVERVLKETGLEPACLDIELTENAVIENSQTAAQSLRYLNDLGVSLSIDDFGTGYSSLSYIKRLPVRRLKIDRSFVQNLEHSGNDEAIVRAIVNLGHSLGLRVIAEGVETEGQIRRLSRLGCDEVQGNLISPPLSAEALAQRFAAAGLDVAAAG